MVGCRTVTDGRGIVAAAAWVPAHGDVRLIAEAAVGSDRLRRWLSGENGVALRNGGCVAMMTMNVMWRGRRGNRDDGVLGHDLPRGKSGDFREDVLLNDGRRRARANRGRVVRRYCFITETQKSRVRSAINDIAIHARATPINNR